MRRFRRCSFDDAITALLFITIAATACLMPAQSDTWWQLRAGEDTWRLGHPVLRDWYSFTVNGAFWPNHEWLTQTIFFAAYWIGGLPLLTMFAAAVVTTAWAIVWRLTPGRVDGRFLLVVLALTPSSTAWSLRPQVMTLLGIAIALHLIVHRKLIWLPLLMLVWANLHGGFVLGIVILGAAMLSTIVAGRAIRTAALALGASLLVTLATPLGLTMWTEIPQSLARLRAYHVAEFEPAPFSWPFAPFWAIAALLVALCAMRLPTIIRRASTDQPDTVALAFSALALLPLAIGTERNAPPFLLAAVPAIAALWPFAWSPLTRTSPERPIVNAAIVAAAATAACVIVAYAYTTRLAKLQWTPLPPRSIQALTLCTGPLYNRYDEGGYLIWFAPEHKVFLDGRQDPYPPSLIAAQVRAETTGDYRPLFERYDVGCAYVPSDALVTRRLIDAGWTPLYRDARWAVLAP